MKKIILFFMIVCSSLCYSCNCEKAYFYIQETLEEMQIIRIDKTEKDPYRLKYLEGYTDAFEQIKFMMDQPDFDPLPLRLR